MADLFTHLLEGQNLAELQQFSRDGDQRRLGIVGRNMVLINANQRTQMEMEAARAEREAESAARSELARRQAEEERAYTESRDRDEAMRLSRLKTAPRSERLAAVPDSNEAVDDFINGLY